MESYFSYLDALTKNYNGSVAFANRINVLSSLEIQGFVDMPISYVKQYILPTFVRTRDKLREIPAEDEKLVKGVLGKIKGQIRMLRHYIKTGKIEFLDKELKQLLENRV